MRNRIINMVTTSMLAAVATVLFIFFKFPIFYAFPYLTFDFSDIPALLAGIICGPVYAVAVELIKNLIELITEGAGKTLGFGNIMNFIVGCAFTVPFSILFRRLKWNSAPLKITVGCLAGMVGILLFGIAGNYLIAPLYFKFFVGTALSADDTWKAVVGGTLMNLVKGGTLCAASVPVCLFVKKIWPSIKL